MFPTSPTARFGIKITTVDPTQGIVRGVMKADAQERGILIDVIPNAFRWPQVGENWMVEQKNGTWYLDGMFPDTSTPNTILNTPQAGDVVLSSATGTVHVIGSPDGLNDFTFTKPSSPRPSIRFTGALQMTRTHSSAATLFQTGAHHTIAL